VGCFLLVMWSQTANSKHEAAKQLWKKRKTQNAPQERERAIKKREKEKNQKCVWYLYSEKEPLPFSQSVSVSVSVFPSFVLRLFFCVVVFPLHRVFCSLSLSFSSLVVAPAVVVFFFFSLSHYLVQPALCPIFVDWEALVCFLSLWWMSTLNRSRHNSLLSAGCCYVLFITVVTATSRNAYSVLSEPVCSRCISTSLWYSPLLLLLFSARYRHRCQT
jgi:hypothetical protein